MLITSARFQARPGKSDVAAAQVAAIFQAASKASDVQWMLWAGVAGVPYGTFLASARLDNLAHYLESGQKMAADPGFQEATQAITDTMVGPTETYLNEVIAATGEIGEPKPLLQVMTATLLASSLKAGLAWSAEVAQFVTDATGAGVIVSISKSGPSFQMSWLGGADNAAGLDEVDDKLNGDADYLSMIEAGSAFFIPGSSQRAIIARIG